MSGGWYQSQQFTKTRPQSFHVTRRDPSLSIECRLPVICSPIPHATYCAPLKSAFTARQIQRMSSSAINTRTAAMTAAM